MGVKFSNVNPPATGGNTLATIQKDPATGEISVSVAPSSSSGGVNAQTVSYLIVSGDKGKLVSMNGTTLTATLPAAAPSSTWYVWVENTNASPLTVARNGHTIDGAASDLTLNQNQGCYITTDGTNWFTERGIGSSFGGSFSDLTVATGDVSFSTAAAYKLTNVHDPSSAQDAATKNYVDTNAPSIKARVDLAIQSASIATANLIASAPAGLYRISYYLNVTQAASTSSSILLILGWTDGSTTTQSFSTPAIVKNTVGYFISDSIVIEAGASVALTYATTYASVGGTALNYSLRVHVELI